MPGKMRVKVCGNREILVLGLVCWFVFCFLGFFSYLSAVCISEDYQGRSSHQHKLNKLYGETP